MLPWIACVFFLLFTFITWFVFRKKPSIKWRSGEIVLFVFFVLMQIIDVVQTYFAVNVIGFAIEKNPLYRDGFDIWSASVMKIAYIFILFFFLRPLISNIGKYKVRPRFYSFMRYTVLIVENVFSWGVVISNEMQAYLFIEYFLF